MKESFSEIQSIIFTLICLYFLLFSENFMPDNLLVFGLDIFLHFPSEQIINSDVIFLRLSPFKKVEIKEYVLYLFLFDQ